MDAQINYLAVLVMAVVYFAIGGLWYSPILFGKTWMAAVGKTEEEIKAGGGVKAYIGAFIGALVLCFVLEYFLIQLNATDVIAGVQTAFWAWLGFVTTIMGINALFQGSALRLYVIDAGYALVGMLVAGGVLAIW